MPPAALLFAVKILLTGPTGFIGSAFTRLALSRGHQVAGLIIPSEHIPTALPASQHQVWLRGTLEQPPWSDITAFKPEVCVHTAWITAPGIYLESPENERFRDASLRFLRQVVELGTQQVLGLGTCIEYQISEKPLAEDSTPIAPTTTYARCKNELRLAFETESKARGFSFCWGRVFYPYGPGEHPSRLCSAIIQKLMRGEKITLKTPKSTKDYIYIDDLAAALLSVVEKRFEGNVNLGTGTGTPVRRVAEILGRLTGKSELIEEASQPVLDPFPYVVAETGRIRSLGWKPMVTIEEGLQRLLNTRRGIA
jgi:nucleoside-diphosphate-sugar epimerase